MKQYTRIYKDTITLENLLQSWQEFLRGKRHREDVIQFGLNLADNISSLQKDLAEKTYIHNRYYAFNISDPKPRNIHKASVCDRLLHHFIYALLYPYFDRKFIYDSYSCRKNKGTHRAIYRFESFVRVVSRNNTKTCWVLKCDIKKFFANIDHNILKGILGHHIVDQDIQWLVGRVIDSFHTPGKEKVGLPLGNLTSQLLVNVYMNEFDRFVKHILKAKYYIRYADDFVILSRDRSYLEHILSLMHEFLQNRLQLSMHPNKIFIKTLASGVDFLGWKHFPHHRILRTSTKKRMFKRIGSNPAPETLTSYTGMLIHGNTYRIQKRINLLS